MDASSGGYPGPKMLKRRLDWEEKAHELAHEDLSEQEGSETSVSSSSEDDELLSDVDAGEETTEAKFRKVKCMVLSGRGVNARYERCV